MIGTYGTDGKGQTTDEHKARWAEELRPELQAGRDQSRIIRENDPHSYWDNGNLITIDTGWNVLTQIRIADEPIGVFCNDAAISHALMDDSVQETISIYCSLLGNIIERKRSEEHEREMALRLHEVVDAADELIGCESLDTLYRRAVELARDRLNVERCSLFLLDENHEYFTGTYGTNAQFQTSDEHSIKYRAYDVPEVYDRSGQKFIDSRGCDPVNHR